MEEEDFVELVTCCIKECYIYVPIPPAMSYGHRAELWGDLDKCWFKEVTLRVVHRGDSALVRLSSKDTGELFAECPLPSDGTPLTAAVDPVVDSSRYYVLRIEDVASRNHAFIGVGFGSRNESSDFSAALDSYRQHLRKQREALALRQRFEDLNVNSPHVTERHVSTSASLPAQGAQVREEELLGGSAEALVSLQDGKLNGGLYGADEADDAGVADRLAGYSETPAEASVSGIEGAGGSSVGGSMSGSGARMDLHLKPGQTIRVNVPLGKGLHCNGAGQPTGNKGHAVASGAGVFSSPGATGSSSLPTAASPHTPALLPPPPRAAGATRSRAEDRGQPELGARQTSSSAPQEATQQSQCRECVHKSVCQRLSSMDTAVPRPAGLAAALPHAAGMHADDDEWGDFVS